MYCVFCGKPDVASCQSCGRWVCPRHSTAWRSKVVCIGCGKRLVRIRLLRITVIAIAAALIGLTVWWALKD